MYVLQIRPKSSHNLNNAVDAIASHIGELDQAFTDSVTFVHSGSTVMGSGEACYVGIDIKLPNFTSETLSQIQPIIAIVVALVENQVGDHIEAQLVLTDSNGTEDARVIRKLKD